MIASGKGKWRQTAITPTGLICIAVGLFGCVAIYNATYHLSDPFQFVFRQIAWLAVSVVALLLVTATPFAMHRRLLPYYCLVAYIPLVLVLFFGIRVHGMRGWFALGEIYYQPSEMAKPVFILSLAWVLERTKWERASFSRGFLPPLAVVAFWTLPIFLQPDFGSLLIYCAVFVLVHICTGGRWRHLGLACLVLVPLAIWAVAQHPYVADRFLGFINPERYPDSHGWHIIQFKRSLASGGLTGQSWGKGMWSKTYLPLGYSDSIFATLGEAIGLVGLVPFVLLLVGWAWYGYRRVRQCADVAAAATIIGLVGYLCIQAFVHFSVNLGLMPPTGITLPLISYGGSSLMSTAIAVGLVESLARELRRETVPTAGEESAAGGISE